MKRAIRDRLPNRRACWTVPVEHGRHRFYVSFGIYPDGRLAEVFANGGKVGSDARTAELEAATAVSIALQCGVPLEDLRSAMPRDNEGRAEGLLGAILDSWKELCEAGAFSQEAVE